MYHPREQLPVSITILTIFWYYSSSSIDGSLSSRDVSSLTTVAMPSSCMQPNGSRPFCMARRASQTRFSNRQAAEPLSVHYARISNAMNKQKSVRICKTITTPKANQMFNQQAILKSHLINLPYQHGQTLGGSFESQILRPPRFAA